MWVVPATFCLQRVKLRVLSSTKVNQSLLSPSLLHGNSVCKSDPHPHPHPPPLHPTHTETHRLTLPPAKWPRLPQNSCHCMKKPSVFVRKRKKDRSLPLGRNKIELLLRMGVVKQFCSVFTCLTKAVRHWEGIEIDKLWNYCTETETCFATIALRHWGETETYCL